MSHIKHLKSYCHNCGEKIEFPADALGMTVECPHCSQQTELTLPPPPEASGPTIPTKAVIWAIIAILILGGGLAGSLIALKKAQRLYGHQNHSATNASPSRAPTNVSLTDPTDIAKSQFSISPIKVEKNQGTSLIYATGTVVNLTDKQRFGVKVELDLLDAANQKIGTARDYQAVIEPRGQWAFKALVVDPKTVAVSLASIKEGQ